METLPYVFNIPLARSLDLDYGMLLHLMV